MGSPGDAVLQRLALEQFHGDKRAAFELADVVNRADIRMIQRRCGARFAAESFDGLSVVRNVVGKKFQRNVAAEARVLGLINHAHPAAAKLFDDFVVGDSAANDGRSVRHSPRILRQRPSQAIARAEAMDVAFVGAGLASKSRPLFGSLAFALLTSRMVMQNTDIRVMQNTEAQIEFMKEMACPLSRA